MRTSNSTSPLGRTAIVFDLDGTLVDSEPNYFEAGRELLARYGVTHTWQEHERTIGVSTAETIQMWQDEYGITDPLEELLDEKNATYLRLARRSTQAYPEMVKFVRRLHGDGVPMIVASGSSLAAIHAILEGTGLDAYLTKAVSADEVPSGKPEPDVFLEAARRLGVDPADCVVMEDAAPGAVAAHKAGMRCIAIPYVAAAADDAEFATADLLFKGGQREFTAQAAYDWLSAH
ncbi:HAD family phosphatase [Streptomyces sp. TRM66268-LWL]|uniref:HAD family phosphatase n=1 Tax=Streptomyces polyasparticus TaxID=2767826 RepID=A0ABR7SS63_9ACTN|nr:HAD family phosphatase [Streptomyces polyasparticus]MBC9717505.1 HAD family phosphatase [Streptomyces polyasparticus]